MNPSDMAPAQGAIATIYQVTDRSRQAHGTGALVTRSCSSGWLSELAPKAPLADNYACGAGSATGRCAAQS